ncbi:hypothetical protein A9Q84_04830 [Halobacteriovorax marinus]|uniref:Secreted protein n=1 Tax=Halobacteriovorax marinus TaxID=97084 RepID=A0A1Y5FAV5_9BACT|nr:hypothetical protein A9Q84_04830 [Halobacteriovorax marinus]
MKRIITLMTLICMAPTMADFKTVKVSGFTGSYDKPDGSATATELVIPSAKNTQIEIKLTGIENGYLLTYGDQEFTFENPPAFINDLQDGTWSNVNYSTIGKNLSSSINSLYTNLDDSSMSLNNFSLQCSESRFFENYGIQIIDGCLKNGKIQLKYLKSTTSRKILNILDEVPEFLGVYANDTIVKDAKLTINNHKFSFVGKIQMGMSAKVKISGHSEYQKENNRIAIRIDKAKASFINIKNKIFEELKKSESDTMKVKKPYIYLLLK